MDEEDIIKEKLKGFTEPVSLEAKLESLNIELTKAEMLLQQSRELGLPQSALDAVSKNIQKLKKDKQVVEKEIKHLENLEEQENTQQELEQEEEEIIKLIRRYDIAYISSQGRFIYCRNMERESSAVINPEFNIVAKSEFGAVLNDLSGRRQVLKYSKTANRQALVDLFQTSGASFTSMTFSFNEDKWDNKKVYNQAHVIRRYWIKPNYAADSYDHRFDFWMHCLSGGKKENQDHLEQWIAYKYLHPERSGNTPSIDIGGQPGGNGKGTLAVLLRTIFTNMCVVNAAKKELMDGFNSMWGLAMILHYDEPGEKELPVNKLKQATGSEEFRQERKGIDASMVDRNYSILFTSNNPNGVVQLAGTGSGGEDRRFSVINTNLVMTEEAINQGLTDDIGVKEYISGIHELVKNRSAVSAWMAHIIKKHNVEQIKTLSALHGEDYHARFNRQKSTLELVFDAILPVFKQNRCIPVALLEDLVRAMTRNPNYKTKGVVLKWQDYLTKYKVPHEKVRQRLNYYYNKDLIFVNENPVTVITMDGTVRDFDYTELLKRRPNENQTITIDMIKIAVDFDADDDDDDEQEEINPVQNALKLIKLSRKA